MGDNATWARISQTSPDGQSKEQGLVATAGGSYHLVLAPFSSITSLARDFWLVHIMSSKAPPLALVQPGDPLGAVAPSESRPLRRALVGHPPRWRTAPALFHGALSDFWSGGAYLQGVHASVRASTPEAREQHIIANAICHRHRRRLAPRGNDPRGRRRPLPPCSAPVLRPFSCDPIELR